MDLEGVQRHQEKLVIADEAKEAADARVAAARKRIAVADWKFRAYSKGVK